MANVSVYNMEGKEVEKIDLSDAVFGVEVNEHLVHSILRIDVRERRKQRRVLKFPAAEENPGDKKGQGMQDRVPREHLSGQEEALYSLRYRGIILSR